MIINFGITRQNKNNEVEFFNSRGQVVKSYYLSQLKEFVAEENPELENGDDINDFLDEEWTEVTQRFFNYYNSCEFKSQNTPNQKHV